jgi:hypothetical protein
MTPRSPLLLGAALLSALAACARNTKPVVDPAIAAERLPFLVDGRTSREDVLLRLGIPSAEYEDGRIFAYVLRADDQDELVVVARELDSADSRFSAWRRGEYSLVLVFDERHLLKQRSLVVVR